MEGKKIKDFIEHREIKVRCWHRKFVNQYDQPLNEYRNKLYSEGKRFGNDRYTYNQITLGMWEKETGKKYKDGLKEVWEMDYDPIIEDDETSWEGSHCRVNLGFKDKGRIFMFSIQRFDIDGTEIYEGDYVSFDVESRSPSEPEYKGQKGYVVRYRDYVDIGGWQSAWCKNIKIISNIYEPNSLQ